MLSADEISANYDRVRERIVEACARVGRNPSEVEVVAITKGHPAKLLASALRAGITEIGENRIQEAYRKYEQLGELRERISWNLVGHLQRNKVKDALAIFDIIHSLDSRRLADEIAHRHQLMGLSKPVPCLRLCGKRHRARRCGLVLRGVEKEGRLRAVVRRSRWLVKGRWNEKC